MSLMSVPELMRDLSFSLNSGGHKRSSLVVLFVSVLVFVCWSDWMLELSAASSVGSSGGGCLRWSHVS